MLCIWCRIRPVRSSALVSVERRGGKQFRKFGDRIRERRLELGLSQEDLAETSGLHRTYVGHLERGEVNASLLNILKIAAGLDVDGCVLIEGLSKSIGDPRRI